MGNCPKKNCIGGFKMKRIFFLMMLLLVIIFFSIGLSGEYEKSGDIYAKETIAAGKA
jgi:hypothetical protein